MAEFIHLTYHSSYCGLDRGVNVLLPEGYNKAEKYPVIYFHHGIFGNEYSMPNDKGIKFDEIISKAAANGKKFIIVFPDMFARKDLKQEPGFNEEAVLCYDNFIYDLTADLMPFIKSNYSILEGRENTAVCGFSMGGRESLFIGLSRPDLFGYIGAFAPAPGLVDGKDKMMIHKGQLKEEQLTFAGKEKPFYVQVCCGTNDDVVGQFPKSYHNIFEKNKVEHTWFEVPQAGHDFAVINPGFEKFVENIF